MPTILITDRVLRLLHVVPLAQPPGPGEEGVTASVTDMAAVTAACAGADAVVRLGGIATEGAWASILDVDVNGTHTVFEAARRATAIDPDSVAVLRMTRVMPTRKRVLPSQCFEM